MSDSASLTFYPVAEINSLPPGKGRTVHIKGRNFALYHLNEGFFAVDDACPHRGASLGAGCLEEDGMLYCPLHGWAFDPRNGACLSNAERPVKTHPTRVEGGQVWIGL